MRVGILTISDRSSRGERPDGSGPLLRELGRRKEARAAYQAAVERFKALGPDHADELAEVETALRTLEK